MTEQTHLLIVTLMLCCTATMIACGDEATSPSPAATTDIGSAGGDAALPSDIAPADDAVEAPGIADSDTAVAPPSPASDATPSDAQGGGPDGGDGPGPPPPVVSDPCDLTSPPLTREIVLPFGETLYLSAGDDYLAFWGAGLSCDVVVSARPESAEASLVEGADGGHRLTPDVTGTWTLTRGQDTVIIEVDEDYLTPDTFVNYNYSPVTPLAQSADGAMWVASPVSNAVHRVVLTGGTPTPDTLVPTGSWPTSLAIWTDPTSTEWLLVSQTGRDTLGFLNSETRRLEDAIRVGNEPAGLLVDGDVAYVALSGEDRVARVDLITRTVLEVIDVGHDPRAMVLDTLNGRLFVASLLSSNAHPRGPIQGEWLTAEEQHDVAVIDTATFTVTGWVHEVGTILRGLWLNDTGTELLVAASHSHNTANEVDADTQPHTHRLVRVDVDPTSEATLTVIDEVDLDGQPSSMGPAPSPFTMKTTPDGEHLIVTLAAGQAVLVLDAETREEVERLPAGSDPRGVAFAEGRFWTYAWLDNQLVGWPLPGEPGESVQATVGDDPTPMEVKQGQRIFNDGSFSKRSEFSCNNCHIDGITDGLVWDILTDGPVNTIAFRNIGGSAPFLWGGQLPTLFDFSREVLKLVGANASGAQMGLLTTYMQSVTAPPNPFTLPGGKLTEQATWGKALFEDAANCAGCHAGTLLTNQELVAGKTDGVMTDVPSLFGAYDTGPWGREGQWTTLEAMVAYAVEFTEATLNSEELAALTAYVREQPADRLYLTSSRPLNHAHHIWHGTSIELTFSATLSPQQEPLFSFWTDDAESQLVAGTWIASGRIVRFLPEAPLAMNTAYRIDVEAALVGALGQVTPSGITIDFQTGGLPGLDVSGNWALEVCQATLGCASIDIALLQSDGGQVTGVTLDDIDEGEIDHLEGVVDGTVLALDPFTIDSVIGPIYVENGVTLSMWDIDDDGYADAGDGAVLFEFAGSSYPVEFYANRINLPGELTPSSEGAE
jgi:DNA-binding beta-propeller fold protein YncE/mono/diheme cytochrome c family protein